MLSDFDLDWFIGSVKDQGSMDHELFGPDRSKSLDLVEQATRSGQWIPFKDIQHWDASEWRLSCLRERTGQSVPLVDVAWWNRSLDGQRVSFQFSSGLHIGPLSPDSIYVLLEKLERTKMTLSTQALSRTFVRMPSMSWTGTMMSALLSVLVSCQIF